MIKSVLFLSAAIIGVVACSVAPTTHAMNTNLPAGAPYETVGIEKGPKELQKVNVTKLWLQTCASCHGEDGKGGGAGTGTFHSKAGFEQDNDRYYFDMIVYGNTSGMPAYGDTFTEEEMWALVVHIRELQSNALRKKFGSPKAVGGVYSSQKHKFKMENVVTSGLKIPWSIDWLPDGKMLVTNRPGGIMVFDGGEKFADVTGLPPVVQQGQGGQMEVSVHPTNGWVYISVADPKKSGRGAMTKIYRGKISVNDSGALWTDQETIFEVDQQYYSGAGVHFGCKIVFDGNGHVLFSIGERGTQMKVQDDTTPYGKVMRLNLDGSVPSDNPIRGNPMWTTGHRNQQGLTFDLQGNLWDTEHGPRGGDELNLLLPGENYGWPIKAFSINYNDSPFRIPWNKFGEDYALPVYRWLPSCAASGLDVVKGSAFPNWKGDLLAGGLAGNNVDRFTMKNGKMIEREEILHGIGRVRDIAVHKDGTVYVVINGPDKIVRLVPAG